MSAAIKKISKKSLKARGDVKDGDRTLYVKMLGIVRTFQKQHPDTRVSPCTVVRAAQKCVWEFRGEHMDSKGGFASPLLAKQHEKLEQKLLELTSMYRATLRVQTLKRK